MFCSFSQLIFSYLQIDWYMYANPGATVDKNIPIRLDISAPSVSKVNYNIIILSHIFLNYVPIK